jgi:hypothetical protein
MQYIKTKYIHPTNHKGARIKATSSSGISLVINYDYGLNADQLHSEAALRLAARLGWIGQKLAAAGDDDGYIFVPVTAANTYKVEELGALCA